MARSTEELVGELQAAAVEEEIPFVAIIVGFEESTEYVVWNGSAETALDVLNEKLARGGEPIGLASFDLAVEGGEVRMRSFAEYEGEKWVAEYLNGLVEGFSLLATSALDEKDHGPGM